MVVVVIVIIIIIIIIIIIEVAVDLSDLSHSGKNEINLLCVAVCQLRMWECMKQLSRPSVEKDTTVPVIWLRNIPLVLYMGVSYSYLLARGKLNSTQSINELTFAHHLEHLWRTYRWLVKSITIFNQCQKASKWHF